MNDSHPDNRWYVTTAIPYVNARPHIGFAFEVILTDALARYHRQRGEDVRFLTGTDENSLKNATAAMATTATVWPRSLLAATTAVVPDATTTRPPNDESSVRTSPSRPVRRTSWPEKASRIPNATAAGTQSRSWRSALSTIATEAAASTTVVAVGVHDPVRSGQPQATASAEGGDDGAQQ